MGGLTLAAQRAARDVGGALGRKIKPIKCNDRLEDVL
jgi:hypothetical protein